MKHQKKKKSWLKKLAFGGAGVGAFGVPIIAFPILAIALVTGGYLAISQVKPEEERVVPQKYNCSCGDCSQGIKLKDGVTLPGNGSDSNIAGGGMGNIHATAGLSSKAFGDEQVPGATAYESQAIKDIYKQLRGYGYSEAATFGILGNMWQESHFKPTVVNPTSGVYGLIQWDANRRENARKAIAEYNRLNPDAEQLSFDTIPGQVYVVHWEMSAGPERNSFKTYIDEGYKITYEQFMSITDPQLACEYYCVAVERCWGGQDASNLKKSKLYQNLNQRKQFTSVVTDFFRSGTYDDTGVVPGDYDSTHSNTGSGSSTEDSTSGSSTSGASRTMMPSTNGLQVSDKAFETTGRITSNVASKSYLTEEKSNRARKMYLMFRQLGYSDQATFGILGNCWQESDFDLNETTGRYSGLFQLSGERLSMAKAAAEAQHYSWNSIEGQSYGVHYDWTEGSRSTYCWGDNGWLKPEYLININKFQSLTDTTLACDYFCVIYEGCYVTNPLDLNSKHLKPEIANKRYQHLKQRRELALAMEAYFMGGNTVEGGTNAIPSPDGSTELGIMTDVKLHYGAENVDLDNWTPDYNIPREVTITECKPLIIKQHLLTSRNYSDFDPSKPIDAFVVHYWAGNGRSGNNLYSHFNTGSSSANFCMGTDGIVWQFVPVDKAGWASNDNANKLSIEVANPKANGQYASASYESLVHLTAYLSYTYNLSTDFDWGPNKKGNMYRDLGNIRRHYDNPKAGLFRGKACPLYWTPNDGSAETGGTTDGGNSRWIAFKEDVTDYIIRFHDHPNFAPQGDGIAGIESAQQYKKDSNNANWANGSVIDNGTGITGETGLEGLYEGVSCGCEIPCKKCNCHDEDWEELVKNHNINGNSGDSSSNAGTGENVTDGVTGSGPTRAEKDPSFGNPTAYKIENGQFTWTGNTWQSTVFLAGARQVMIELHAMGPTGVKHKYYNSDWAKTSPDGRYVIRADCSGYVSAVMQYLGYFKMGETYGTKGNSFNDVFTKLGFKKVSPAEAQPGDIYWRYGHIGILVGFKGAAGKDRDSWAYDFGGDSAYIESGANYFEPCDRDMDGTVLYRPVPLDKVNIAGKVYEYHGSDAMQNPHFVAPVTPEDTSGTSTENTGGQ